ncbi:MAG: phosphodiester glycosidase family protein [Lentisphaerae bacterium]|nr:phosphodiester glycosidase family protein [Lentisphaerota bacterium]
MKKIFCSLIVLLAAFYLAAALPTGSCDWSNAEKVAPGIRLKMFTLKDPRPLNIMAVQVDLSHPRIYLRTTGRDKDWGKPMPDFPSMKIETKRNQVGNFLKEQRKLGHDMRLAVNAAPWRPWTKPYNHKYSGNIGLAIADREVVAVPSSRPVPAFIIRNNGVADMITVKPGDKVDGIKLAVSGFDFVLRDGKQSCDNNMRLEPRTFFGLSKDKKKLYFLVVDGRQKGFSEGFAYCEGAKFLKYLGAHDGINMDGGGSTTLVTCKKDKVAVVNSPPGTKPEKRKSPDKYTRPVANSVGVCLRKIRP